MFVLRCEREENCAIVKGATIPVELKRLIVQHLNNCLIAEVIEYVLRSCEFKLKVSNHLFCF